MNIKDIKLHISNFLVEFMKPYFEKYGDVESVAFSVIQYHPPFICEQTLRINDKNYEEYYTDESYLSLIDTLNSAIVLCSNNGIDSEHGKQWGNELKALIHNIKNNTPKNIFEDFYHELMSDDNIEYLNNNLSDVLPCLMKPQIPYVDVEVFINRNGEVKFRN